jgi:hypothetical protein
MALLCSIHIHPANLFALGMSLQAVEPLSLLSFQVPHLPALEADVPMAMALQLARNQSKLSFPSALSGIPPSPRLGLTRSMAVPHQKQSRSENKIVTEQQIFHHALGKMREVSSHIHFDTDLSRTERRLNKNAG